MPSERDLDQLAINTIRTLANLCWICDISALLPNMSLLQQKKRWLARVNGDPPQSKAV